MAKILQCEKKTHSNLKARVVKRHGGKNIQRPMARQGWIKLDTGRYEEDLMQLGYCFDARVLGIGGGMIV